MSVEESWQRIVAWLAANAPVTAAKITAPAPAEDVDAAASRFPNGWPDELRRFYRLQNGVTMDRTFSGVITVWDTLSLDAIEETQRMYLEIYAEFDELAPDGPTGAGEPAWTWLPEFVPIGQDLTGCALFVDTRPGPAQGCVTAFEREDAAVSGPSWPSLEATLADVAGALESGGESDGWLPTVVDGALEWEPA